jgi:hypothetical protein
LEGATAGVAAGVVDAVVDAVVAGGAAASGFLASAGLTVAVAG